MLARKRGLLVWPWIEEPRLASHQRLSQDHWILEHARDRQIGPVDVPVLGQASLVRCEAHRSVAGSSP